MAKPGDLAWPLLAAALWGGMYVVSRLTFDTIPPITLGLLRLLVGVAVLALALRRLPLLRDPRVAGLGALLAATLMLQFWGTALAGAAAGSLLTLLTPVFVALLAPWLLAEVTRAHQWAGIGVALAGAAVVSGGAAGASLWGDLLLVGASLTWGAYTVVGAPLVRRLGALEITTGASMWAVPLMLPGTALELASGRHLAFTAGGVLGVLYLGVFATALAWWAWYRGVERLPAVTTSVFFLAQPVVGIALSIPIFHLALSAGFVVGSVLIVLGMLLAS
ncbi:MAG TPA: DMT family transporter [Candidatus Dormibacteraeota bacterium]|nr:DMT family transporter [Candidatus Dormibacteraeota bacterium]